MLDPRYVRVRTTERAPGDPCHVLERRHGLAEIVERSGGVFTERHDAALKRTTRVPRAVAAPVAAPVAVPAAAPADPFAVGATVELHGLVSNPAANGRRVVIVRTPPDFAARGRINVNLDGAVKAVKRENMRAVPGGVGAAPSTAAMAWLTPGFLSSVSPWVLVGRVVRHLSIGIGRTSRAAASCLRPPALASCETLALEQAAAAARLAA